MKRTAFLIALLTFASVSAAETGMDTVVRMLESRYSVRHHGIFGMWLAKPMLIGSGVSGLKIAEFHSFPLRGPQFESMREEVARTLGSEWASLVETWSRDGECSFIFARASGDKLRILILSAEPNEGLTLMQMNASGKAREKWFNDPVEAAAGKTN